MIADAAAGDRTAFQRTFDVCVIGAGPAGITLARRLAAAGADVALMEAGGLDITAESQDVYVGRNVGRDYFELDTARLRYFGGSSNHWGGMCRGLDSYDFEPHAWHPLSGWPIGKADLDPYRTEVRDILDLSAPAARRRNGPPRPEPERDGPEPADFPDVAFEQTIPRLRQVSFRFSPPVRFGEKYRAEIEAAPGILLVLNANLVDIRLDEAPETGTSPSTGRAAVAGAVFRSYDPVDPGFTLRARFYCLCTGGLENPRLLLAFRSQRPEGLGNRQDLVGRFFCEHPSFAGAAVIYEQPREAGYETYAPTAAFLEEQEILNVGLWLHADALPAIPNLARATLRSVACSADFLATLHEQVLGRSPGCGRPALGAWFGGVGPQTGQIRMGSEQTLDRDSRLRLGAERDAFGLPRPELDWRLGEQDFHTIRTGTTALAMHLAEQGIGRARLSDWLLAEAPEIPGVEEDQVGSWHHMCTTRMADDPRHGVVDRDCRVHDLDNLYIGGSSVFATGGYANPTYTIVQLALRLGDHLAGRLSA